MPDGYLTDNYDEMGGARKVIGGELDVVSGGEIDIESGGALKLDGTAITSTAAELNALDGITSDVGELNILDGVTADKDELNILDGALLDVNELNTLNGITADVNELNILDGVTVNAALINALAEVAGKVAIGVIYVPANVADVETVTIGADVYEFDRAVDGVVGGNIAVTAHGDDTPANATDALIAVINASGTEAITAIDISANEILLVADVAGAVVTALAETMGGGGNVVSAANMASGEAAGTKEIASAARVATATEVTIGNLHIALDFVPVTVIVQIRHTSTGVVLAWDGDVLITGGANPYITINNDGGADWDADDTIHVLAFA